MRAVRLRRFSEESEDVGWLIDGLLPDTGWTLLVGQQGLGKSTFGLQLCTALQDGVPFLGRSTLQRNILFIQADSSTTEWRQMVKRIASTSSGYTVVDVEPKALSMPGCVTGLHDLISKTKPGFIVFDSLYNLTSTPINSEAVLIPINTMKSLAGSVPFMLIHHPPHNENRAAGHHSLGSNCSNEWWLLRNKLKVNKSRLASLKEVSLSRDINGLWTLDTDGDSDLLNQHPELGNA